MRAVNLLPRDEQRDRLAGRRTPVLVAVGGIVLITIAAAFLGHSASRSATREQGELDSVNASIARLPGARQPVASSDLISRERIDRTAALSAALSSRIPFDRLLRQIARVLPENAWLTGLKASAPVVLAPTSGTSGSTPVVSPGALASVTIDGATYSQESVARVLARLELVPALQDVQLTSSALVEPQSDSQSAGTQTQGSQPSGTKSGRPKKHGKTVVTFTIAASLRTGAAR